MFVLALVVSEYDLSHVDERGIFVLQPVDSLVCVAMEMPLGQDQGGHGVDSAAYKQGCLIQSREACLLHLNSWRPGPMRTGRTYKKGDGMNTLIYPERERWREREIK